LAKALADHQRGMGNVERRVERRARCALHAMVRPQRLRAVGHGDALERPASRMLGGKRQVAGRMPVLGQHHMGEFGGEAVDGRDDLVAARHRQAAAGAEVVLHVHHDEDIGRADRDLACIVGPFLPLLRMSTPATRCAARSAEARSRANAHHRSSHDEAPAISFARCEIHPARIGAAQPNPAIERCNRTVWAAGFFFAWG
jgi:hypothetical protein